MRLFILIRGRVPVKEEEFGTQKPDPFGAQRQGLSRVRYAAEIGEDFDPFATGEPRVDFRLPQRDIVRRCAAFDTAGNLVLRGIRQAMANDAGAPVQMNGIAVLHFAELLSEGHSHGHASGCSQNGEVGRGPACHRRDAGDVRSHQRFEVGRIEVACDDDRAWRCNRFIAGADEYS